MNINIVRRRMSSVNGNTVICHLQMSNVQKNALGDIAADVSGDNYNFQQESYNVKVDYPGKRGGARINETRYEGSVEFSRDEIIKLFAYVLDGSDKSNDFKAVAAAVIAELRR